MNLRAIALPLAGLFLVFSSFPACSSQDPDAAVPVPAVSRAEFVEGMASLVCQRRAECSCSSLMTSPPPVVGPGCEATVQAELSALLPEGAGLTFDETCGALFLDEVAHAPSCQSNVQGMFQAFRCAVGCSLLVGTARENDVCTPPASTLVSPCGGQLTCNNGRCSNACPADNGERCGYDQATQTSRGCRAGSACSDCTNDPINGYVCHCRAFGALGEPCAQIGCGANLLCGCPGGGLSCSYDQRVCRTPPAVGEPCPEGVCGEGAYCGASSSSSPPQCLARRPNGSGCNAFEQCASGFCPDGVCRTEPGAGEPCPGGLCGAGFQCTAGVCVVPPGPLCTSL